MKDDTLSAVSNIASYTEELAKVKTEINQSVNGDNAESRKAREELEKKNLRVKELEDKIKKEKDFIEKIKNGELTQYYCGQAIFQANDEVKKNFTSIADADTYCQMRYGARLNTFSESVQNTIKEQYDEYKKANGVKRDRKAYDVYLEFSQRWGKRIVDEAQSLKAAFAEGETSQNLLADTIRKQADEILVKAKRQEDLNKKGNALTAEEKIELDTLNKELEDANDKLTRFRDNPQFATIRANEAEAFFNTFGVDNDGLLVMPDYAKTGDIVKNYYVNASTSGKYVNDDMLGVFLQQLGTEFIRQLKFNDHLKTVGEAYVAQKVRLTASAFNDIYDTDIQDFSIFNSYFERYLGALQSGNINEILKVLSELKTFCDTIHPQLYNHFVTADNGLVFGTVGGKPIPLFLQEIADARAHCKFSLFEELAKEFAFDLGENNVANLIELIGQEKKALGSGKRITDYIIRDPAKLALLQKGSTLDTILNGITGVVLGMIDGTNANINNFTKKVIPNLVELDTESAKTFNEQILDFTSDIDYLRQLSIQNASDSWQQQKEIAANIRPKMAAIFCQEATATEFKNIFGIDPRDYWGDSGIPSLVNLSAEDFATVEPRIIAWEAAMHKALNDLGLEDKEIAKRIMDLRRGEDLVYQTSTALASDTKTITPYDACMYIVNIYALDANVFYSRLNHIVDDLKASNKTDDLAPIFGQEYAVRMALANVRKMDLFNEINARMKREDFVKQNMDNVSDGVVEELSACPMLYNLTAIFGGAGTGKTDGGAGVFAQMLTGEDVEYIAVAPEDSQKEKISNSVGATSAYTVHELLAKVYDKDVRPYEVIKDKDGNVLTGDFNINHEATLTGTVFDNNKRLKILVVDEIGKINIADLKALCDYAHKEHIFILGLGDLLQITPITYVAGDKSSTQDFTACIEDCIFTKAPELTASLRIQNLAKLDNYNTFRAVMADMHSMQHRNVQIGHLSKAVTRQIDLYYDEDDKGFYGEKIEKDRAALLDTMTKVMAKDPDKTYAIITDDTEDAAFTQLAAKHPNIQIVPYESMQGGEWDYAFVDVAFSEIEEKCNKVKSLYTLSQRSRIGTVFVDHGISKALSVNITSNAKGRTSTKSKKDNDKTVAFKKWRKLGLSGCSATDEDFDAHIRAFHNPVVVGDGPVTPQSTPKPEPEPEPTPAPKQQEPQQQQQQQQQQTPPPPEVTEEPEVKPAPKEDELRTAEGTTADVAGKPTAQQTGTDLVSKEGELLNPDDVAPKGMEGEVQSADQAAQTDEHKAEEPPAPKTPETPNEEVPDLGHDEGENEDVKPAKPEQPVSSVGALVELLHESALTDFYNLTNIAQLVSTDGKISDTYLQMYQDFVDAVGSMVRCRVYKDSTPGGVFWNLKVEQPELEKVVQLLPNFKLGDGTYVHELFTNMINSGEIHFAIKHVQIGENMKSCLMTTFTYNDQTFECPTLIFDEAFPEGQLSDDILPFRKLHRIQAKDKHAGNVFHRIRNIFAKRKDNPLRFIYRTKDHGVIIHSEADDDPNLCPRSKQFVRQQKGKTFMLTTDEKFIAMTQFDSSKPHI